MIFLSRSPEQSQLTSRWKLPTATWAFLLRNSDARASVRGITIDGEGSVQIVIADPGTTVILQALTLIHGLGVTTAFVGGGGAIFANGTDLQIRNSLIENNHAAPASPANRALAGGIYARTATAATTTSTLATNRTTEKLTL